MLCILIIAHYTLHEYLIWERQPSLHLTCNLQIIITVNQNILIHCLHYTEVKNELAHSSQSS